MAGLRSDPRVQTLAGKMLSRGSGAGRFEVETLGMWFLWRTDETDSVTAKSDLERFLSSDEIDVLNALWVLGVEVEEPTALADGFTLLPIESMPDSWDKEAFLQVQLDPCRPPAPVPSCAIVKQCRVHRVAPEPQGNPERDTTDFWAVSGRLEDVACVLNAVEGLSCLPFFSTSYVLPDTPVGPFGGGGGGMTIYDVLGYGTAQLLPSHVGMANALVMAFEGLDDLEKARLRRILGRLSQSKRRSQIEDKILDLGIALEMLLLDDNASNEQLSLAFRLRGSWLLGRSVTERAALCENLRCLYRYRSQVAHSGALCRGKHAQMEEVRKLYPEYQRIAEAVCQRVILEGAPDWNSLVLGREGQVL